MTCFKIPFVFSLISLFFLTACSNEQTSKAISQIKTEKTPHVKQPSVQAKSDSTIQVAPRAGLDQLTDVQALDPGIHVDLKYAGTDNFMKKRLYYDLDKLYLQKDVAERLVKVQAYLKKLRPDLSLLLYDGVRPLSVQWDMWNALDTIPVKDRVKFVSNPASGSIHNYGAAIDLTICHDATGVALDMGAGYDDIREIAYPKLESFYFKQGLLTSEHIANRQLLRKVMSSQGFTNIPTEWWHFNACSRASAKKKYTVLQ